MIYTVLLIVVPILLYYLYKKYQKHANYWTSRNIKEIKMSFIKQLIFRKTIVEMDTEIFKQLKDKPYGGLSSFSLKALFVKDLDLLKRIMVKDFEYFPNRSFQSSGTNHNDYTNQMLSAEKGERWKKAKSLATLSPLFTTGKIKRMFPIFDSCGENFIKYIEEVSENGEKTVHVQNAIERFTMSVIASAVFAIDSQAFSTKEDPIFVKMARKLTRFDFKMIIRIMALVIAPILAKVFKMSFFDLEAQTFFADIIKSTIEKREKSGEKWNDFLQLMLEHKQKDADGNGIEVADENEKLDDFEKDAQLTNVKSKLELDERTLIAQCLLFLFAGFDTTESLLTWVIYELALNQDVQEKLRNEIEDAKEKNGGKLNYEAVMNSEYLDNVINETLRKYPPSGRGDRLVDKDYKIEESGIILEKGIQIAIPIYAIQNDPTIWPNPQKFDPNRFTKEEKEKRHPFAWIPFGSGPRNCIGMRFALIEAKAMLSNMILKFKVEPSAKTQIPAKFSKDSFFLKPAQNLELKFTSIEY